MPETKTKLEWEPQALKKYQTMITKIPMFHRDIAKTIVDKKAEINAKANPDMAATKEAAKVAPKKTAI